MQHYIVFDTLKIYNCYFNWLEVEHCAARLNQKYAIKIFALPHELTSTFNLINFRIYNFNKTIDNPVRVLIDKYLFY